MAILTTGNTFSDGDQVTAAALNTATNSAAFTSGAVDNASTQLSSGAIIVKDGGITTAKLNDAAVKFSKLSDVVDDDTMATATSTSIPTSESVKAYVDNAGSSLAVNGYQYLPSGLLIQWGTTSYDQSDGVSGTVVNFPLEFPNGCFSITANDYGSGSNSVAVVASSLSQLTCWGKDSTGTYATTVIKYIAIGY